MDNPFIAPPKKTKTPKTDGKTHMLCHVCGSCFTCHPHTWQLCSEACDKHPRAELVYEIPQEELSRFAERYELDKKVIIAPVPGRA